MVKKILLGIGGTPYSNAAIQRAVELAYRFGAAVTGVTVVDLDKMARVGLVPKGTLHEARRQSVISIRLTKDHIKKAIDTFESACKSAGIRYQVRQEQHGESFDLMIDLARYHDLMIFGLRSIFEYDISEEEPSNTLARLISAGVRPIIAVSATHLPIRRILIAYSGSMESAKTMKRFIQLGLWPDADILIVTAHDSEDTARHLLIDAAGYCRAHGRCVSCELASGSPKDSLMTLATSRQADLIVLGNSARSLLLRRVIGETALHIIRNADRPLFLCQ